MNKLVLVVAYASKVHTIEFLQNALSNDLTISVVCSHILPSTVNRTSWHQVM